MFKTGEYLSIEEGEHGSYLGYAGRILSGVRLVDFHLAFLQ